MKAKTPNEAEMPYHAFYSEKAAAIFGSHFYLNADEIPIEATGLYIDKEYAKDQYKWDDKVYCGEVFQYFREGKLGNLGEFRHKKAVISLDRGIEHEKYQFKLSNGSLIDVSKATEKQAKDELCRLMGVLAKADEYAAEIRDVVKKAGY